MHPFPPAPMELGTHTLQLQAGMDEPFSQEATGIITSLSSIWLYLYCNQYLATRW